MLPHDGIPVVFPELGMEFPRIINGPGLNFDTPVDLVVLGKPGKIVCR